MPAALEQLHAAGIDADMILDTTGREISRTSVPPEYADSPILFQLPAAGIVVPTGTGRVRLVVASALRRDPVVTMPSLTGLSLSEAQEVLERIGLVLGETSLHG
jgi:beta-lactam-binding protein with PASTA domain